MLQNLDRHAVKYTYAAFVDLLHQVGKLSTQSRIDSSRALDLVIDSAHARMSDTLPYLMYAGLQHYQKGTEEFMGLSPKETASRFLQTMAMTHPVESISSINLKEELSKELCTMKNPVHIARLMQVADVIR